MTTLQMNEATVRGEKLDPLLQLLGYKFNTDLNVYREHQFSYPKVSLGRKGKNDAAIIGKPDYICEARGIATWVLEAKAESSALGTEVDAQAYTYAAHPEIRALYYALSNGVQFALYRTISPTNSPPLIVVSLENLEIAAALLSQYLSKDALLEAARNHQDNIDLDSKSLTITGGSAYFDKIDFDIEAPEPYRQMIISQSKDQIDLLDGTIYPIEQGKLRSEDGILDLVVEIGGQTKRDIEFQRLIGIDIMNFQSTSSEISRDKEIPTIFQTVQHALLRPGDTIQSSRVSPTVLPIPMEIKILVDAFVYLDGNKIKGEFRYSTETPIEGLGIQANILLRVSGRLDINVR